MGDLSPHFSRVEFQCHCCGGLPPDWQGGETPPLVLALEQFRAAAGQAVHIISGYRCPRHNRAVGGALDSQHLRGHAADLYIPGKTVRELYDLAGGVGAFARGGIGVYPEQGFVHVDVRGYEARWGKLHGQFVSLEEALT